MILEVSQIATNDEKDGHMECKYPIVEKVVLCHAMTQKQKKDGHSFGKVYPCNSFSCFHKTSCLIKDDDR